MKDPSIFQIEADLCLADFMCGVNEGRWRVIEFSYPRLDFKISAINPDGSSAEYGFRADLTNYPAQAPEVKIWNLEEDRKLATHERPKGGNRVTQSFKDWGSGTVYRPWDRKTGPHNNNSSAKPHLAWRCDRDLTFIFEDLHGILVSNGRKIAS